MTTPIDPTIANAQTLADEAERAAVLRDRRLLWAYRVHQAVLSGPTENFEIGAVERAEEWFKYLSSTLTAKIGPKP